MKTTILAPTGDSFKVLFQDEQTLKGPIVGISGTLAAAWKITTDEQKLEAIRNVIDRVLKSRDLNSLHDQEIVFTTNDTAMEYNLAVPAMERRILQAKSLI
jgi:hypothetical protein